MVRAVDKADAMLTLSSALKYRKPFTIFKYDSHWAFLLVVFLKALFSILYFSACIPPHSALPSPHFL